MTSTLFKIATTDQKKYIVTLMLDKLVADPEAYTAYLVSRFNRDCQVDLLGLSEDLREYLTQLEIQQGV